jgi:uncharacterized protein with HEPN domain
MPPEARKYLWDALEAARRIARFTSGKSLEAYESDELLRSAVERQFEMASLIAVNFPDAMSAAASVAEYRFAPCLLRSSRESQRKSPPHQGEG